MIRERRPTSVDEIIKVNEVYKTTERANCIYRAKGGGSKFNYNLYSATTEFCVGFDLCGVRGYSTGKQSVSDCVDYCGGEWYVGGDGWTFSKGKRE